MERAIDAIWQEQGAGSVGNTAFHTALYRLRQALRRDKEKAKFILVESGDYRLDSSRFEIDANQFESLLRRAIESNDEDLYKRAIALHSGRYLENLYYDWAIQEAEHLTQLYLQGLGNLRKLYEQSERYREALEVAQVTLKENCFLEDVHQAAMIYMEKLGDRQGVLRQFELLTEILESELGAQPLPETKMLCQQLLNADHK